MIGPTLSPVALRRFWGWVTVISLMMWPVAAIAGWVYSVAFVSHLSLIALILAAGAAWQGARSEVRSDPDSPNPGEKPDTKP